MALPPLDICKLEATGVGCGVDMNQVWHVVSKLSDETDNIRVTGNPLFDSRYLNYDDRKKEGFVDNNFYDRDSKVKGDWRTHFFTRTAQILLHSSDPKRLSNPPVHSERCDCVRPEVPEQDFVGLECDCWGHGVDPTHQVVLQRLMTVPPYSNIAKTFSKMEQRSAHFTDTVNGSDLLLVPFRYAEYFTGDACTSVIDLLRMLVKGCHFRPKLLPVHCEFFLYSELYQLFLSDDEDETPARSLFAEFLADLEHVEFYWLGGLRGLDAQGEMTFRVNPSMHIPGVFLEAALGSPSPKLDTVCFREYAPYASVDSCLNDIAPLLSSCRAGNEYKSKRLPTSAPYKGLRRLHVFGQLMKEASGGIISSIILHQDVIEGLELRCRSKVVRPSDILHPICHILTQPSVQFLVINTWLAYEFKELFFRFLDMNMHCDISFATYTEEVVIPARETQHSELGQQRKALRILPFVNDTLHVGIIFTWLKEAKMDYPLRSITVKSAFATSEKRRCFLSCLATCQSLTLEVKGGQRFPFADCLVELSTSRSLQVLRIHGCLPFTSIIDSFCTALSAIYGNCAGELTELSLLNNRISSLPPDKLELFFKTLVSSTNLGRISVNLRGNDLKDAHLDVLLKVWRQTKTKPEFKSLLLDSSEQEDRVAEMVLEEEW